MKRPRTTLYALSSDGVADWFVVNSLLGHSYEFRVDGQTSDFYAFAYRFAANGTTALPLVDNEGGGGAYGAKSFTWTQASANSGKQFIEVTGYRSTGVNTPDAYTARFYETTISFPRYNNTSGQATVLLLQNTTARAVAGEYTLHTAAGALVVSTSFSIAPLSALVVNTAGTSANNTSGTIVVDHDGGYGGLTGKAVALDPATGFSFDTLGAYLPN